IEVQSTFLATYLYRIAQECVRSAAESAKASRIVITLSRRNGQISLSISDNAPRRGSNHVFPGKMVHEMIQHRVNLIRGILSIHRKSSGGVKVTCQVDEQKGAYDENHE
ncbi:MAG TPA: hypothetical protein VG722_01840, partial [Tepidisphaeraceae bacterium]|nr:hypothetical protein [Tepidisphaeraceae bacterium]